MKKVLQKLMTVATCFLTEDQVTTIEQYIVHKQWNSLRLYIGDLAEEYEVRLLLENGQEEDLDKWLMIEEMNDIAIDIAIQMNEVDEETQPKPRTRVIKT